MAQLKIVGESIQLRFPYSSELVKIAKGVPGAKWSKKLEAWLYPATTLVYEQLTEAFDVRDVRAEKQLSLTPCVNLDNHPYKKYQPREHQFAGMSDLLRAYGVEVVRGDVSTGRSFRGMDIEPPVLSRGWALLNDMGTGKTKTVIDMAEMLFALGLIKYALVATDDSLVYTWEEQIEEHGSVSVAIRGNGSKPGAKSRNKKNRLLGLSQVLATPAGLLPWYLINIDGVRVVADEVASVGFGFAAIDESTSIKNFPKKRTQAVIKTLGFVPYKTIMSGNPTPKAPDEIFAQYAFVEPGVFGTNYYAFRGRYFTLDYFDNIKAYLNQERKDEYLRKFHSIASRVTKAECLDLPPKVYETRFVDMTPEQAKAYEGMQRDAVAYHDGDECAAAVIIAKYVRLSQIAGGFFPGEGGHVEIPNNPKVKALLEVIGELPRGEQVVVWARFHPEIETIKRALDAAGITCDTFYGPNTSDERTATREAFRDKKIRVFIGSPATGGKGINELKGCTYVIYYANSYSAEHRQQSEDRNHRDGVVGDSVTYVDLLTRNTIDGKVLKVLRSNKDFSDAILSPEYDLFNYND